MRPKGLWAKKKDHSFHRSKGKQLEKSVFRAAVGGGNLHEHHIGQKHPSRACTEERGKQERTFRVELLGSILSGDRE